MQNILFNVLILFSQYKKVCIVVQQPALSGSIMKKTYVYVFPSQTIMKYARRKMYYEPCQVGAQGLKAAAKAKLRQNIRNTNKVMTTIFFIHKILSFNSGSGFLLMVCLCISLMYEYYCLINLSRYDPVELDPEEMCKMAKEQPQVFMRNF